MFCFFSNLVKSAPIVDLYDHSGFFISGVNGNAFTELMDDFVLPATQVWTITTVLQTGHATIGLNVTVHFYRNSNGTSSACTRIATVVSSNPMKISLSSPCTLTADTYWMGIARISGQGSTQLQHNMTQTIEGSESRVKGDFCGTSSFVNLSSCLFSGTPHDFDFTLRGCMGTVCDIPSITLLESGGSTDVDEGDVATSDTYTLVLDAIPAPGEIVTITPTSDTIFGVSVSPSSAVFDTTDWDMPVTMTVTAVDDTLPEVSPHTSNISHATSSNNANYDGFPVDSVIVNILDDNDEIMFVDGFEEPPPP